MQQAPLPAESGSRSLTLLLLVSILLPPAGLILLWRRGDIETGKKAFGTLGIVILSAAYAMLIFGPSLSVGDGTSEDHYAELEQHRARQQAAAARTPTGGPDQNAETANANTATGPSMPPPSDAVATSPTKPARNYWTDFRGPSRDGRYDEAEINTRWPSGGLPRLWSQPVGGGYASFVVAEGRAFTIEQRRNKEVVAAYDVETGREMWTHAYEAEFKESMGGDGPRATPTWNEGRIYSIGALGDLRCLDSKTGKLAWSKNILADNAAQNLQWGVSGAPLVVDDKVIVVPGGPSGKSVVAYNKLTGARVWSSLNDRSSYTSPMLVTLSGRRQVLVVTGTRVAGLEAEGGSLLWDFPWDVPNVANIAQPVIVDANRFIISAGYGKGAALVEVTRSGNSFSAVKVWENVSMKNKFNSSVFHDGYLYGLDEGILTCLDVQTGERKWKGGRYGYGQLLLANGHLIVITEEGELVLLRATPDKQDELAKFEAIQGKTWNYPAIAGGRLLVRNQTQMACFDLSGR
ncbi:MAG TPA: PQQ-binding-like beta-propeller repeat protein [Blastocatellia bacterium]|jgi:outer membrane protein assembly factor BamB